RLSILTSSKSLSYDSGRRSRPTASRAMKSCLGGSGLQIVRWNGPLGNFDYVTVNGNTNFGVAHGDVVRAQMVGSTITVSRNGVQVATATDTVYTSGAPGVGFAGNNPSPTPSLLFGFSSFTSSD